ncbi:sugar phosphate isomerase/epimerase family protein [Fredinandcohnia humi]
MKKGVNEWCFPEECSIDQAVTVASKAGFDGIELNLSENGNLSLSSTDQEINRLHMKIKDYGLELPSLSTSLLWKYSLTSNNPKEREKGKQVVKKMSDIASLLQIDTILVVPGIVSKEVSYDTAYERSQEALLELGEYARKSKVTIGIENVWNKFLVSPLEMKKFIQEINIPNIGVYFDVGNILLYGFPEQWIQILAELIKKVHVKDFKTAVGNFSGFTSLLQGDVNWKEVMLALANIQYNDYLIAEIPSHPIFPEKSLQQLSQSMDFIIQEVHSSW